MKKKILSTILCVALLLSTLLLPLSVHAEAADYTVSSLEELAAYAAEDLTGKTIELTADITVTSNTSIASFNGTLDGKDHTVSGLTAPLFTAVSGATVRNLNLVGTLVTDTETVEKEEKGLLAATSSTSLTVTDCTVTATVGNADSYTSTNKYVGGFVGAVTDGAVFTDCTVNGSMTVVGNNHSRVGGFVGEAAGAVTFSDCTNNMPMTVTLGGSGHWNTLTGGFLGYHSGGALSMTSCVNKGTLNGVTMTAGMVGQAAGSVQLLNCVNRADITSTDNATSQAVACGMIGQISGTDSTTTDTVTGCVNLGAITSVSNKQNGVGSGFFGWVGKTIDSIENCANMGTIKSDALTAGFVAQMGKTAITSMKNCLNTGDIRATGGNHGNSIAGGIVARWTLPSGSFENILVTGEFYNPNKINYIGALVGANDCWQEESTVNVTNFYYEGSELGVHFWGAWRTNTSMYTNVVLNYPGTENDKTLDGVENFTESSDGNAYLAEWDAATAVAKVRNFTGIKAATKMEEMKVGQDWYVTEGTPIPAALADVLLSVDEQTADIRYKGLQYTAKDETEGTFSVRFVAVLDSLNYAEVTYNVIRVEMGNATPGELSKSDTKVYSSLTGYDEEGTKTYNAGDFGGTYFSAISFDEVPADKTVTFVVTPVVKGLDGAADVQGTTFAAVFANGELVRQYQY